MRQLGYLGKTPHRGDFVRYNVPRLMHGVWDDWLATVLVDAADVLDNWPNGYDAAPLWRFGLSPDIAGEEARAGVVIASRDSVGRRFPFALFGVLADSTTPLETLASDTTLDALEMLARRALDDESAYESLKSSLGDLQDSLPEDPTSVFAPFRAGTAARTEEPAVYSEDAEVLADRAGTTRLLDATLRQSTGPYSVWQRRDDGNADGCLFVTGGLPRGAAAFVLFGAEWPASVGGRLGGSARSDTRRPGEAHLSSAPDAVPTAASGAVPVADAGSVAGAASAVAAVPTSSAILPEDLVVTADDDDPTSGSPEQETPDLRDETPDQDATAPGTAPRPAAAAKPEPTPPATDPPVGIESCPPEALDDSGTLAVETLDIDEDEEEAPWDL